MKSFLKKFFDTETSILIRNSLKRYEVHQHFDTKKQLSISDAFLWRTDNNFVTKFIFTDIFNTFYNQKDSFVEILFFDSKNNLIKKINLEKLNNINEIIINKEFLNNVNDFGSFFIFHYTRNKIQEKAIISNRCYLGYKNENNFFSYVHGNYLARGTSIYKENKIYDNIIKRSLFKNQIYQIQKNFLKYDYSELFFVNPFTKEIKFYLNEKKYKLGPSSTIKINIKDTNLVKIRSNIMFFRPTIFSYRSNKLDVHHS